MRVSGFRVERAFPSLNSSNGFSCLWLLGSIDRALGFEALRALGSSFGV